MTSYQVHGYTYSVHIVETDEMFDAALEQLKHHKVFAVDTETTGILAYENYLKVQQYETIYAKYDALQEEAKAVRANTSIKLRPPITAKIKRIEKAKSNFKKWLNGYSKPSRTNAGGLWFSQNLLSCIQVAVKNADGTYEVFIFSCNGKSSISHRHRLQPLYALLDNADKLIGVNFSFDFKQIGHHHQYFLNLTNLCDITIAEYIITRGRKESNGTNLRLGLKYVAKRRLDLDLDKKLGRSMWYGEWTEEMLQYACLDVVVLFDIWDKQLPLLRAHNQYKELVFYRQLVRATCIMELHGCGVDKELAQQAYTEYHEQTEAEGQQLAQDLGIENINSPMQLLDGLEARGVEITSTDKKVLKGFKDVDEVKRLLEYRTKKKAESTYFKPLATRAQPYSPGCHRIYPSFNLINTVSGRLSSSEPNMQNQPATAQITLKNKVEIPLRSMFVPAPGCVFVQADQSQVELRILAHLSGDATLRHAFETDQDVHIIAAAMVYGIPIEEVTKAIRNPFKNIQYGIIYGQTAYALSSVLGLSELETKRLMRKYFAKFPSVEQWIRRTKRQLHRDGFSDTLAGTRRWLDPDIHDPSKFVREAAERAGVNHKIQGTSADGIKRSIVTIDNMISCGTMSNGEPLTKYVKQVLSVHDEAVLEVYVGEELLSTYSGSPLLGSESEAATAILRSDSVVKAKEILSIALVDGVQQLVPDVPIKIGSIDNGWQPNVGLHFGAFK